MPNYANTSTEEVHKKILEDAANIANQALAGRSDLNEFQVGGTGQTFFEGTNRSKLGGLALAFDEALAQGDPVKINELRKIGKMAIKEALTKNPDLLIGLILGNARQGNNYFDRFGGQDTKTI